MALRLGRYGFPFGSSPVIGFESRVWPSLLVTKAEGWSAEERPGMALEDKGKLKRGKNGGLETLSFQRDTADLRISEIKSASEGNIEKERILFLTKPDENVSGSKTKDFTPPEVVNIELLSDVIANKISKEEWSCALCQTMATSEKDLNEHMLGKKHMLKVAALRAQRTGKNYSIGLFPKKPTKSIDEEKKGVNIELPADVIANKKSKEEWRCTLCQANSTSEKNLNQHVLGKKPKSKVAALIAQRFGEYRSIELFPKKHTKSIHVEEKEVKLMAQSMLSQKVGKVVSSKKDDLSLSQSPKSEHLKKTQAEVIRNVQKDENDPRKKSCKFSKVMNAHKLGNIGHPADVNANKKSKEEWSCALCQVSASSEKDLNQHKHGKKHKLKQAALRSS